MRRFWTYAGAIALGLAAIGANAQTNQQQLAARGGLWLPFDSTLKDIANIWAGFGLDVHVPTAFTKNSELVLSADYLTHSVGGSRGNVFPLTVNAHFFAPYGDQTMYYGIGAGAFVADVRSASKTVFGLKGTIGLNINEEWFFEVSYFWSDRYDDVNDSRVDGIAGYVGFRF